MLVQGDAKRRRRGAAQALFAPGTPTAAALDPVTNLPNRQRFIADYATTSGAQGDLCMVTMADAQHFNGILRALGHDYADDFVRAAANRIRANIPDAITLYHVSVLSIAFVLPREGEEIAAGLARCFSEPLDCAGIPIHTAAGIGLAAFSEDVPATLRAALTAAQDSRRWEQGWSRYNLQTDRAHLRGFMLLTDLPAALAAQDQLELAYQPKLDLRSGACCGAEALLRWHHPRFGAVSPGEFIPLVESTALIAPLTEWVLHRATAQAARWAALDQPLNMAVNISPVLLRDAGFVEGIIGEQRRCGLDPSRLELEFTEGMLTPNDPRTLGAIRTLRDAGMQVALDDFGTGFSNFSYLAYLPATILKIDQSFMRSLQAPASALLVRSIIQLAHELDYRVVAEGIEDEAVLTMLRGWGCDEGQGYHISRPLFAEPFEQWRHAAAAPHA
jgi:EAL domain-containing protein (putative c-di-GMP-specific phosphodiesterase class I)